MGVSGRTEASSPTLRAEPGLALDTPRSRSRDELELTVVSSRGLRVFFCKRPVLGAPQPLRGEPIRKRALEESVDRSLLSLDPVRIKIALLLALRTYKKELVVAYDLLTASDEKATDVRPHGRAGGNAGDVPRMPRQIGLEHDSRSQLPCSGCWERPHGRPPDVQLVAGNPAT